jgi:hypothetical protein
MNIKLDDFGWLLNSFNLFKKEREDHLLSENIKCPHSQIHLVWKLPQIGLL